MTTEPVVIGKNIIEILTTGMYHNPLVIYREYVQNSVDSINNAVDLKLFQEVREGEINITIDPEKKSIEFYDNATGIPSKDSWKILTSIAASTKDRNKNLGFRGIGRLAGLAYCEKLTIETSYPGESIKSQLVWDGEKLRSIISSAKDQKKAHEVIESITTFCNELPEENDQHYFKVTLHNIRNNKLLSVDDVERYLRMVAPVDFNPQFIYSTKIRDGLKKQGVYIAAYRIFVNTNEVFKPYRTRIYKKDTKSKCEKAINEIIDIEFFELSSVGEKLAVGWYALTETLQLIPVHNEPQGIRIRKGNIQIGDQFTVQRFFREARFHNHFIGEIHVISQNLIPNGQRDYFDESDFITFFEEQMKLVIGKLSKLCHDASEVNAAFNKIESHSKLENEFFNKKNEHEFVSPSHEEDERKKLETINKEAEKAKEKLKNIVKRAKENKPLDRLINQRKERSAKKNEVSEEKPKKPARKIAKKRKYKSQKLSQLKRQDQKLIGEVYEVIRTVLTPDLAQNLIFKIEERFGGVSDGAK